MDLTHICPLLAILSCLAGALTGLLIFVLTHILLSTCFPSLRSQRQQQRPNQHLSDREVWARFTAEADAIGDADADADADAEDGMPGLEPDADADLDLGLNRHLDLGLEGIVPIEHILRMGIGQEVTDVGLGRAGEQPLWFGMMDVGMAGADEDENGDMQMMREE